MRYVVLRTPWIVRHLGLASSARSQAIPSPLPLQQGPRQTSDWVYPRGWTKRISAVLPDLAPLESFIKVIALALLLGQTVLYIGSIFTHVMLHGDGSYFVYAIAAGDPWQLKWKYLATRASTYVLTVVPTELLSSGLSLSGEQIAALNGAIFYGVQLGQYIVLLLLAWRRFPGLLIFPILQYGLSTGLGFGFPSEMLLAPGFFWICQLALSRTPICWPIVYLAFAGLTFSHELALPSAVLVVAFAWYRRRQMGPPGLRELQLFSAFSVTMIAACVLIWFDGGGDGAVHGAIYVFDPRRVLNDPTLWLIVVAVMAAVPISHARVAGHSYFPIVIGIAFFVLAASIGFAFEYAQGRYDSARTLIGVWMPVLGLFHFLQYAKRSPADVDLASARKLLTGKIMIVAVLSVNLASSLVFLQDWSRALSAFRHVVNSDPGSGKTEIVSGERLKALIGPLGNELNESMGFTWTWPYRSIVVASGFRPSYVLVDPDEALAQCAPLSLVSPTSRVPAAVTLQISRFACAQPAPPDRRYFRHWLLHQLGWER